MTTLVPTIAILAAVLLLVFGARMLWAGADRRKGALMLVAAAVLVGNVVIWTW